MKVLLLDIETSFMLAAVWDRYNNDYLTMDKIVADKYIISWSAKWLGEKKMLSQGSVKESKAVLKSIWTLMDKADVIITHNGNKFDLPLLNVAFIKHGMQPPSQYRSIDTLAVAKARFKFTSNRLDDLGKLLKVGSKLDTGGFDLWKDVVLKQSKKALAKMIKYNEQDVVLLEAVYMKLRPWHKTHPNLFLTTKGLACPVCGSKHITKNGSFSTNTGTFQKYKCSDCGHSLRNKTKRDKDTSNLRSC